MKWFWKFIDYTQHLLKWLFSSHRTINFALLWRISWSIETRQFYENEDANSCIFHFASLVLVNLPIVSLAVCDFKINYNWINANFRARRCCVEGILCRAVNVCGFDRMLNSTTCVLVRCSCQDIARACFKGETHDLSEHKSGKSRTRCDTPCVVY